MTMRRVAELQLALCSDVERVVSPVIVVCLGVPLYVMWIGLWRVNLALVGDALEVFAALIPASSLMNNSTIRKMEERLAATWFVQRQVTRHRRRRATLPRRLAFGALLVIPCDVIVASALLAARSAPATRTTHSPTIFALDFVITLIAAVGTLWLTDGLIDLYQMRQKPSECLSADPLILWADVAERLCSDRAKIIATVALLFGLCCQAISAI